MRTVRTGSYALEICSYTTQYGIRSVSYTGPKLWNSLSIDVKKIKPFSSFRQYIKNSMIDGYNTIIDS